MSDGIPLSDGSHEDSLGGDGCLKETQGYTIHSARARHTFALITRFHGESAADRQEIGLWSMSVVQDPVLCPIQSVVKRHNITDTVFPDRNSQSVPD